MLSSDPSPENSLTLTQTLRFRNTQSFLTNLASILPPVVKKNFPKSSSGLAFLYWCKLVQARCLIPPRLSCCPRVAILCNTPTRTYTTWWSCLPLSLSLSGLPVGVSSSAGASPYHANAAALSVVHASTTFDHKTPRDIERLIPGQVCLRVEAVSPSRLRYERGRVTLHIFHLVALVLHRCACLHITPFVPEPAPTVR